MRPTLVEKTIYFVTDNVHKLREVALIGRQMGFDIQPLHGLKVEIQSDSIEEVSRKSALLAYFIAGKPILVEDAGLFIKALNGFPGPYSSYVYKTIGINGVLKLMKGVEDRRACFKSAATVIYGPYVITEVGEVCGWLAEEPRGLQGFGFDPIFIPEGSTRTFGEMSVEEKNALSHRARSVSNALGKLKSLMTQT